MKSLIAIAEDTKDVCRKTEIPVSRCRVENIGTDARGGVEIEIFHTFSPDIKGRSVMKSAGSCIEEVIP